MKKNLFQIVIVFVTILVLSTTVMARGKKHYGWWSPFSKIWFAIEALQEDMNTINEDIEDKLANLSLTAGSDDLNNDPGWDTDVSPLVCPSCRFPSEIPPPEILARLQGAYLPNVYMSGINLSGADLIGADLRGATITWADLSDADLSGVDFSIMPHIYYWTGKPNNIPTNLTGTDMSGAILDGVIWDNTICPDGTNSDANGETCENNLKPLPVP
jgi:uncharacterized protein YjbI with pentapeptide repeats